MNTETFSPKAFTVLTMHNGEWALGCRDKGDGHRQDHRSKAPAVGTECGRGGGEDAKTGQFAEAAGKMRRPVNFRSEQVWVLLGDESAVPSQLTTTGLRLEDASSSPWGGRSKGNSHTGHGFPDLLTKQPILPYGCVPQTTPGGLILNLVPPPIYISLP